MDRVDKQHIAHLEDFARKLYIECDPRDPNFPQVNIHVPFPVLKAGHPVRILIFIFYCSSIFVWTYNLFF